MGASSDLLLGRIAVELGFVKSAEVEECIKLQETLKRPLGQLLLEKGYLTDEQLDRILKMQKEELGSTDPITKRRKEAALFGKLAVREGYVTFESMNECLSMQAREGEARTLGEILVDRGYLTARQVQDLLKRQFKKIMRCKACKLRFTVLTLTEGRNAACPRCKGPLEEVPATESTHTDAEFRTTVLRAVDLKPKPKPAAPKVKATCIICDFVFEGAPDDTGRLQCPACKSSFLPK